MKITTKSRYALRALLALGKANPEIPVSIRQIAEDEDLSPVFLEQIFSKLKKKGIVTSSRGLKGGFKLNKPMSDISVRDIMEAAGENMNLTPCTDCNEAKTCDKIGDCDMYRFWKHASDRFHSFLTSVNLQSITDNTFV